jgi:hypothetical protein
MKGKVQGYSVFTAVQYPGYEWVVAQMKGKVKGYSVFTAVQYPGFE